MISRNSSSHFTSPASSGSSSRASSIYPPSALTEGSSADEEDEVEMSAEETVPTRPLSVAIPKAGSGIQGPYCPRRPNLKEILANTSPQPWTLAAFMAYLSSNHCLETLEFTMDAGRYKKHFAKMMSKAQGEEAPPVRDREYVQLLWNRLIDAYIRPNGSREVNLPSNVRDPILDLGPGDLPPAPEKLDPAVAKIYELMEDSVLVPFLNSCYPQTADPKVSSMPFNMSSESISGSSKSRESSSHSFRRHGRNARSSPPPQTAVEPHSNSYHGHTSSFMNRKSAPSTISTTLNKARFSIKLSPSSSHPAVAPFSSSIASGTSNPHGSSASTSGQGMTDDSGSTGSGGNDSPMTPPTSPPVGDLGLNSPGQSPRQSRDSGMWKKLGRLSGMGRKKSHGGLREED
ncbi:hypothetical protein B0A48_11151 [Cryoendolithus antarcticus]|uniref:RGS domain-containing protein n=1 Tax=Cryoendolithus antarcticus TaxID=1507870 RepID=A0A1V8SV43_9PEZI|nr:hypothetical protein B0A48_11151 [Cryoendolithus antarcticus]